MLKISIYTTKNVASVIPDFGPNYGRPPQRRGPKGLAEARGRTTARVYSRPVVTQDGHRTDRHRTDGQLTILVV